MYVIIIYMYVCACLCVYNVVYPLINSATLQPLVLFIILL